MKKHNYGAPLVSIIKHPDHYREILQLYLDLSKPIKLSGRGGTLWRIDAEGIGYDGEAQKMIISEAFGFQRCWNTGDRLLPIQTGKIYHRLRQLGYDVGFNGRDQADRYENYAINGVSNLGAKDHREAIIEKQERQLERRKAAAEALEY